MHGVDLAEVSLQCPTHLYWLADFAQGTLGGGDCPHGIFLFRCPDLLDLLFERGHLIFIDKRVEGKEREGWLENN